MLHASILVVPGTEISPGKELQGKNKCVLRFCSWHLFSWHLFLMAYFSLDISPSVDSSFSSSLSLGAPLSLSWHLFLLMSVEVPAPRTGSRRQRNKMGTHERKMKSAKVAENLAAQVLTHNFGCAKRPLQCKTQNNQCTDTPHEPPWCSYSHYIRNLRFAERESTSTQTNVKLKSHPNDH